MRSQRRQVRAEITESMWASRSEIEDAVLARIRGLTSPQEEKREGYAVGFKDVVSAVAAHSRAVVDRGHAQAVEPPAAIRAQAQSAAHNQIELSAVLRRCLGAHSVLNDFVVASSQNVGPKGQEILRELLREQALAFDEMIEVVSEEHERAQQEPATLDRRRFQQVARLLSGERCVPSEFGYDFNTSHLGLVASGVDAAAEMKELATSVDTRYLIVHPNPTTVWMWVGGQRIPVLDDLETLAASTLTSNTSLAVGECERGRRGWELTHRQARAALPIAERDEAMIARYADSRLLAAMLTDGVLAASLCDRYLRPLESGRDGGQRARATLQAYLSTRQNTVSTAHLLGVSRRTVTKRLHDVEAGIGQPVANAASELEAVLQYHRLLRD